MKIYNGFENIKLQNTIVTLGIFDGVHLAHQKILSYMRDNSQAKNLESVLITFWPHPKSILNPNLQPLKFLSTQSEKIEILQYSGIDHLIIVPFTQEFSEITAMQFVTQILVNKLNVTELVLGYDHHFGKNREGNIDFLNANSDNFNFAFKEIPKQYVGETAVNSSNIRQMLFLGNAEAAAECLNRPYDISGTVIKGNQLGREIGFPTANVLVDYETKLIPAIGVYAVEVLVDFNIHFGMLNIGHRPTVDGKNLSIEVNIFDFNRDIYNQKITIRIKHKLRNEQKFDSLKSLKNQLSIDKKNTLMYFTQTT